MPIFRVASSALILVSFLVFSGCGKIEDPLERLPLPIEDNNDDSFIDKDPEPSDEDGTDQDGDGLSLAEEKALGTSDESVDTDQDRISDYAEAKDRFESTRPDRRDLPPDTLVNLLESPILITPTNESEVITKGLAEHLFPNEITIHLVAKKLCSGQGCTGTPLCSIDLMRKGKRAIYSKKSISTTNLEQGQETLCKFSFEPKRDEVGHEGLISADTIEARIYNLRGDISILETSDQFEVSKIVVQYGSYLEDPMPHLDLDQDGVSALEGDCLDDPKNPKSKDIHPSATEILEDTYDNDCEVNAQRPDPYSCTTAHKKGYSVTLNVAKDRRSYQVYSRTTGESHGECIVSNQTIDGFRFQCSTFAAGMGFKVEELSGGIFRLTSIGKENNHSSPAWSTHSCIVGE